MVAVYFSSNQIINTLNIYSSSITEAQIKVSPLASKNLLFNKVIQKDYIERLTQQVAKVIARLIGKDWEQQLLVIEEVYNDWLPINRKDLMAKPPVDLLDWLVVEEELSVDELEAIADLLKFEGEQLSNYEVSKDRLKKALLLLEYVDAHQDIYSMDRIYKIEQLKKKLTG